MPATPHNDIRAEWVTGGWKQPPSLTGGYFKTREGEIPLLDHQTAHADSYVGHHLQDEILAQGPVAEAAGRIGVFACSAAAPVEYRQDLTGANGCEVYIKREDLQLTGSFKVRGASNAVLSDGVEVRNHGYTAASAGNHAQGVAFAARRVGSYARIFMPLSTPDVKVAGVEKEGGEVVLTGASFEEAYEACQDYLAHHPKVNFVHPFDDPRVIAGQGTSAYEALTMLDTNGKTVGFTHIVVPGGGGGLAAGTVMAVEETGSGAKVIVAEPHGSDAIARSLTRGERTTLPSVHTHAEGAAVARMGRLPFDILRNSSVEVETQTVTEHVLINTTLQANEHLCQLECTAALGLAALEAYRFTPNDKVLVLLTGRHISDEKLATLRRIAESDNRLTVAS